MGLKFGFETVKAIVTTGKLPRKKPPEVIDPLDGVRARHSAWTERQNAPATNGFISAGGRFDVRGWIRR